MGKTLCYSKKKWRWKVSVSVKKGAWHDGKKERKKTWKRRKQGLESKPIISRTWTWPQNYLKNVLIHTGRRKKCWLKKDRNRGGGEETDWEVRINKVELWKNNTEGWSFSLHATIDLFPNNYRGKKKKNSQRKKNSFHTLAHKGKDRLRDETVGRIILPHLNLTFNSLNVLFDLAKEPLRPAEQQESHQDVAKASAALLNSLHLGERVALDVVGGSTRGRKGEKKKITLIRRWSSAFNSNALLESTYNTQEEE